MKSLLLAAASAIAVQPVIFCIWLFLPEIIRGAGTIEVLAQITGTSHYVLMVSGVFVLFLGVPIFLILRKLNRVNTIYMMCSGFLAGAIPILFLSFPTDSPGNGSSYGGNWHGTYVDGMIDGVHTKYAWYIFSEQVIGFGIHGLIGAYVFMRVWRHYAKP